MSAHWRTIAFALLCAVQLAVPAHMILQQQRVLAEGSLHRFRTAPVDPADPFRGRYVALRFDAECVPAGTLPPTADTRRRLYAALQRDAEGYTVLTSLHGQPPAGESIAVRPAGWGCGEREQRVLLPFDRYYMDEALAPEAELAYLALNRRGEALELPRNTYVSVRVLDGRAALEELYLDGLPVRDYLRRDLSSAPARP